ncbi:Repressible high-affinity phosphate permease [Teratosphaeria destructans]|uniref:Repressible high-affinity phosphate permease n=1 Tax=Teratosphaeria destructans TaxID=418781 RepID=A0A9W7W016_9PEZI|nr:Repressible high-affinity phosphate permease [Teratosphaeria destructans]
MAQRTAGGNAAFHNFHNDYAHIADPNERRRLALAEIDKAPFGWYHIRAILVAGVGFFTDAYDIFAIGLVTPMLGVVFWHGAHQNPGKIHPDADTAIKVATSGGTVLGQVGFGYLADVVGRKRMYGLELILIIFATLAQSLSAASPGLSIVGVLIFWRVLMGIGIGGDYPLSSIITSEFATTKWRGAMMAAVFANQGWGQFTAGIVTLIVVAGFKESLLTATTVAHCGGVCGLAVDKMWRVVIGFGAVPGCIALYYRLTIPETPRYTFDVSRDIVKAGSDVKAYLAGTPEGVPDEIARVQTMRDSAPHLQIPKASFPDFWAHYSQWKYGRVLLGTAGSWFMLDVAFYGVSLNNATILSAIGYSGGANVYEMFYRTAVGNIILVCAGAIPGYWFTVAFVDVVGRKPIQLAGFVILTLLFCVWGFAYYDIGTGGKLALYVLCEFFFNFGPNATTFIVPGECFPTRYRSTSHGLSAAAGKLGAIIAQVVFGPLRTRSEPGHPYTATSTAPWLNHIMQIFALFMLLGCFTTLLIPETKRLTLEQLAGEVPGKKNILRVRSAMPPDETRSLPPTGTPQYDPRNEARALRHDRHSSNHSDEEAQFGEKSAGATR